MVGALVEAAVALDERFQLEAREPEPGRADLGLLADLELQSADRERVRRRAEVQVDVDAAGDRRDLITVQPPRTFRIDRDRDVHRPLDEPADTRPAGPPGLVAVDLVAQPTWGSIVLEHRHASQFCEAEGAILVSFAVETFPEDGRHRYEEAASGWSSAWRGCSSEYTWSQNRSLARVTCAVLIDGNTSNACCAPGSSVYTTGSCDTPRSFSTNRRVSTTGTSESCAPWITKNAGASAPTRAIGDAASNSSGASRSLFLNTCRSSSRSSARFARDSVRVKSYTP